MSSVPKKADKLNLSVSLSDDLSLEMLCGTSVQFHKKKP